MQYKLRFKLEGAEKGMQTQKYFHMYLENAEPPEDRVPWGYYYVSLNLVEEC